MLFNKQHIVVTGGAGGIGSLLCGALIEQGAKVTSVDRSVSDSIAGSVTQLQGDLSTFDGIQSVAAELAKQDVDVLINLAGLQYFGLFELENPEHVMTLYTVNLVAPVMLTQSVLPAMKKRGKGHIVNIGSTFGSINFAHFVTYSSSKAGLKGFSQALRREVQQDGIAVTYISPRAVRTPLNTQRVMRLAEIINMNMDSPELVVNRIIAAVSKKSGDVYIGFPESFFVRVNALLPGIVDKALAGNDKKARQFLNESEAL